MTQQVSFKGLHMIAGQEGFVPAPYRDVAGVWTIFFGHTAMAGAPDPKSVPKRMPENWRDKMEVAFALFDEDLDSYEQQVANTLGPLEQHEFDGWVMWHYNTGGLFQTSAVAMWKRGDKEAAVDILKQWNKVTKSGRKVVNQHLVGRRQIEAGLILDGHYQNPSIPVWGTDNAGNVIWKKIGEIGFEEARRLTRRGGSKTPRLTQGGAAATAVAAALVTVTTAIASFWDKIAGMLPW